MGPQLPAPFSFEVGSVQIFTEVDELSDEDRAYWLGYVAGGVVATGTYVAIQHLPFALGTAAAEGTFLTHLAIIGVNLSPVLLPILGVVAAVGIVSQAGGTESPSTHGYRDRMSEYSHEYPSWMRFR
jgi:hypothetical protein